MKLPFLSHAGSRHDSSSIRILPIRKGERRKARRFSLECLETRFLPATVTEFSIPLINGGIASQGGKLWLTRPDAIAAVSPTSPGTIQTYSQGLQTNPPPGLGAITTGPDNNIWFTQFFAHQIGMLNTSDLSQPIRNFGAAEGLPADAQPVAITTGPDSHGNQVIWFLDNNHSALGMINPSNPTSITEFAIPSTMVGITGFSPQIVAGPGGRLFFTEAKFDPGGSITASAIGTYNPANGDWGEVPLTSTPKPQSIGITLGPDNNIWFTEAVYIAGSFNFQSYAVAVLRMDGGTPTVTEFPLTSPASDQTLFPSQITAGPDGNLWFAWTTIDPFGSGGAIGSINPTSHVIGPGLPIPKTIVPSPRPGGITAGPDGNVWFADHAARSAASRWIRGSGWRPLRPRASRPAVRSAWPSRSLTATRAPGHGLQRQCHRRDSGQSRGQHPGRHHDRGGGQRRGHVRRSDPEQRGERLHAAGDGRRGGLRSRRPPSTWQPPRPRPPTLW